ncbi:hypothetical protein C8F01DRAFT_668985 [Mycena amicta]|nr:hypothetical protein C8F01DRAFT_668985 [Mycena amicta]
MIVAHSLFPSAVWQAFIAVGYLLGVTILTFFFSRRLLGDELSSKQALSRLTWPRLCTLLIFVDSYLFMFSSGILVFGVGLQMNKTACAAGIYLCVLFYTSSKILIYAFLTEKVYIVWNTNRPRLRSPVYLICIITVGLYSAVVLAMLFGRIDQFRPGDGACVLGLKPTASLPLLSYDLYINILLTALFLYPLFRSQHSSTSLRRVAIRTLLASAVALTTSTVNIAVLTVMHGKQLGWVCLASCGMDVVLNAAALFWVTGGAGTREGISGNRNLSGSQTHSTHGNGNGFALSVPPSPARSSFKEALASPIRSAFSSRDKEAKAGVYKMGSLSPTTREFQIHVTTESQVSRSPPADTVIVLPTDSARVSDSDVKMDSDSVSE